MNKLRVNRLYITDNISKKSFLHYKFLFFNKLLRLKDLYVRKIWTALIKKYWHVHLNELKEYSSLHSLNRYKFNYSKLLPKLTNILSKITNKKIEYNIVNLKSIIYSTDIFLLVLAF